MPIPWMALALNIGGVVLMLRYGLPRWIPLVGRSDSPNEGLGLLGLAVFVLSIAIRFSSIQFTGN